MQEILRQKKAGIDVIKKFLTDTNKVQLPFKAVVEAVKAREGRNWERRKFEERHSSLSGLNTPQKRDSSAAKSPSPIKKSSFSATSGRKISVISRASSSQQKSRSFIEHQTLSQGKDYRAIASAINRSKTTE